MNGIISYLLAAEAFFWFFLSNASAFQSSSPFQHRFLQPTAKILFAESSLDQTSKEDEIGQLTFRAELKTETNPMLSKSPEDVTAFFQDPNNRNLFLTAGGKRECTKIETSPDYLLEWTKRCSELGLTTPAETDEIFKIRTGGVQFPGLQLESVAIMGVKLIQGPGPFPGYEVCLICDERTVKGLRPVVWVFNKLTGSGSEDSTSNTAVTYIEINDSGDSKVTFRTDSVLTINVKFPAVLMKLVPDKQKTEEQGSKSIAKTIGKDIQASIEAFEEAYMNHLL